MSDELTDRIDTFENEVYSSIVYILYSIYNPSLVLLYSIYKPSLIPAILQ